jgi:N-acetylglucosamine-6-phosphate deacetylase
MIQETTLITGDVLTPEVALRPGYIVVRDQRIAAVGRGAPPRLPGARHLEAGIIAPGWIDLHIHGSGGFDLMGGDDAVRGVSRALVRHGCTSYLPTTITAPWDQTLDAVGSIARVCAAPDPSGAQPVGMHLEGPFIHPKRPGMARTDWVRPHDLDELRTLLAAGDGCVRLMTLAPELPRGLEMVSELVGRGIVASVAHSDATYQDMVDAAGAGARHLTHAFNAMRGLHHREPGTIGGALDLEAFTVEAIADGIHSHPAALRLLWRVKGWRRMALVTDAMPAAGGASGVYAFGGQKVTVRDGQARLDDGTLAGSMLTMDQAIRVMVTCGVPAEQALGMASLTPASILGLRDRGQIAPGLRADLVALTPELSVRWTMVGGLVVWQAAGE